jgi:hypothetical protein
VATDASGNVTSSVALQVWTARTGGTQPPLKDASGTAITTVTPISTTLDKGLVVFQADADGYDYLWLDRQDGSNRLRVYLRDPGGKVSRGELTFNAKDYGAVADWNGTTGTDNTAAFAAALAAVPAGGGLLIPSGRYYFASDFPQISKPIELCGQASGLAINTIGTQLVFAAGKNGPASPQTPTTAAAGYWHDIECSSLSTAAGSDVGFFFGGGYINAKRLVANGFGSHGFHFKAGSTVGNGNVNNSIGERLRAYGNRGAGIRIEGTDANAVLLIKPDVVANYGWGIETVSASACTIFAAHADQQYNSSPGAYRDAGNGNSWIWPYSEGGAQFLIDTGSSGGYLVAGTYGQPAVNYTSVALTYSWVIEVGAMRHRFFLSELGTGKKQWLLVPGFTAAGSLDLYNNTDGIHMFTVDAAGTRWLWYLHQKPATDVTYDLGGSGNRWRDVWANQLVRPSATKTANYTLTSADNIVIFNGTSLTATLPDPTTAGLPGRVFVVKNINASALTVASAGTSKTLDGAASQSLAQWAKASYTSDGTQWLTV